MITPAQRAEIRRLYYGEHWKIGTIATQLGLHRETVRAAVERESGAGRPGVYRPSALDPYLPFIRDTLAQYPRLRATRIHEMVRQRGYPGSVNQLRRIVKRLRPETGRTVYRRVVTLVGESAQVDWGSFGKVRIGHGTRAVSGFVMVLGYSRAIAALFTLDQTLESFLRGHVDAFRALGGVARTLVYDNLRKAPSSTAAAPPSSFTPACSSSPATTTSRPDPAHRDAEMRRGKSNARSNTCATPSSPPGSSEISTTSTPSSGTGETTSPTNGATPSNPTVPSTTSGPTRSPACYRSPPIPSRPTSYASSAPARPPTSASTAISTPSPTPTSASP